MALVFSVRGELDLLEQEFSCKNSHISLSGFQRRALNDLSGEDKPSVKCKSMIRVKLDAEFGAGCVTFLLSHL